MTSPTPDQTERPAGGFVGDPAEAFSPPATSGCCGTADAGEPAGSCCGTAETAESGTCCG